LGQRRAQPPAASTHDAAPRGHQVDLAGTDRGKRAKAVAVIDRAAILAAEQPGHGGEIDMRMRRTSIAVPTGSTAGPNWSTKMNGPIIVRAGKAARAAPETRLRSCVTGVSVGRRDRSWRGVCRDHVD